MHWESFPFGIWKGPVFGVWCSFLCYAPLTVVGVLVGVIHLLLGLWGLCCSSAPVEDVVPLVGGCGTVGH